MYVQLYGYKRINCGLSKLMFRLRYIFQQKFCIQSMETKKNTARRDKLIEAEHRAQYIWRRENVFRVTPDPNTPKYFETFPYPYMNGKLHLGHAFSLSKCEFNARYKKTAGFNVLFPFGFHCTGMPICAAAEKLKYQIETYGNPPVFPPAILKKIEEKKFVSQYNILKDMEIDPEEIASFVNPEFWCSYFPPIAQTDLKGFGVNVDFDRSFITTHLNPYYDRFVSWQFTKLKDGDYIKFGKRPTIYSVKDQQICADHDRAEGEGVNTQEYVIIKMKVLEVNGPLKEAGLEGKKVFLAAATLRPETTYGQTNCYVLPSGEYGAFEMKNDEIFICSERAANNMSYQSLTKTENEVSKIATFTGEQLLGLALEAPQSVYQKVYCLPMMNILMTKGTGVVTSVPSDSPDDYATLMDLKNKKELLKKFGLTEEMVAFDPVEIIKTAKYGNLTAVKLCEDFKIKSQNDKDLLAKAKEQAYNKGFYEGVMLVGNYKGEKVQDAKIKVKKDLIESGAACIYHEPDGLVVSRSGDECIVTYIDQWYLNYADEKWKERVANHVASNFKTNNQNTHKEFVASVQWIQEWACSRSFGLGTKIPFDDRYLIESLSDSTIYMAYYTIAHYLHGDIEGKTPGLLGIHASELTNAAFDYIFLKKPYDTSLTIPEFKLKTMRDEFEYWYPVDLRCSGKDLIKNHLTMSLFIHSAIWEDQPQKWPRGFFCNGYILIDGEKMSKSKGNFKVLGNESREHGADAIRYTCADSGDTLDDANFTFENVNSAIMTLSTIEMYLAKVAEHFKEYREGEGDNKQINYFDKVFYNNLIITMASIRTAYEEMKYRDVVKFAVHELNSIKDDYLVNLENAKPRKDYIETWMFCQLISIFPICPHFSEIAYLDHFSPLVGTQKYPKYLSQAVLPDFSQEKVNSGVIKSYKCIKAFLSSMREAKQKALKSKKKDAEPPKFTKVTILYRKHYQPFQEQVLKILANTQFAEGKPVGDWRAKVDIQDKAEKTKAFTFGSFVLKEYQIQGAEAFESVLPYDEREILNLFEPRIVKEFGVAVEIVEVTELKSQEKLWVDAASNVNPGKPQAIFQV